MSKWYWASDYEGDAIRLYGTLEKQEVRCAYPGESVEVDGEIWVLGKAWERKQDNE